RSLADGERLSLGDVQLEVRATPGHTPESISIVVYEHADDDIPYAVLTGDTLFIGDVGRPDLMAGAGLAPDDMARQLFRPGTPRRRRSTSTTCSCDSTRARCCSTRATRPTSPPATWPARSTSASTAASPSTQATSSCPTTRSCWCAIPAPSWRPRSGWPASA